MTKNSSLTSQWPQTESTFHRILFCCTKQCWFLQRQDMHFNPSTFKVMMQILRNEAKGTNHHIPCSILYSILSSEQLLLLLLLLLLLGLFSRILWMQLLNRSVCHTMWNNLISCWIHGILTVRLERPRKPAKSEMWFLDMSSSWICKKWIKVWNQ